MSKYTTQSFVSTSKMNKEGNTKVGCFVSMMLLVIILTQ